MPSGRKEEAERDGDDSEGSVIEDDEPKNMAVFEVGCDPLQHTYKAGKHDYQ